MAVINPFDLYTAELNRLKAEESQNQNPFDIAIREQADRNLGNYSEQDIQKDIEAYNRRNEINRNDPEFQNRVQSKLNQLIDKRLTDPNVIFAAISNDPDLDAAFPTHIDKFDALKQVQESVQDAQNELNALKGYNIEDKGFIRDTLGAVGSGLLNTAVSPYYAYKKHGIMNKLDNLPLNQLEGINKKLLAASQLKDKIDDAKQRMFSNDLATQTRALHDLQYYKGTLDNLALTDEEQQIWDRYGKEYDSLKMQLDHINADKADLLGSRNISTDEARVLMDQYRRREEYKRQGIDPSLGDHIFDAIKDSTSSFGAVGRSLGNVLSSAIPFMIPVIGGALGVASFGSTAMEYATDLMEDHLKKYNELPTEEQLKAALYGALAAGIDYYGSKGLVKGYSGTAGQFFRGIGKTDAMREAERIAQNTLKNTEALSRGMSKDAIGRVFVNNLRAELSSVGVQTQEQATKELSKELSKLAKKELYGETLGTKITRKIAEIPEGIAKNIVEAPVKVVKATGKVLKGIKTGNEVLHRTLDSGIQDMAKAGAGLAMENVGSTLVRQNYKGEYDKEEIAKGLVDGFISGGAFHGISNVSHAGLGKLSGKAKEAWNKYFNGGINLDSRSDFLAMIDILESTDPNVAKYTPSMGKYAKERYDKLTETIEDIEKGLKSYREDDVLKKAGFTIGKDGKAVVDMNTYNASSVKASTPVNVVKQAVKNYNNSLNTLKKYKDEIKFRNDRLAEAIKNNAKNVYESSKTNKSFSETEKETAKQNYVNSLTKEERIKFLTEEEGISEKEAKEYIDITEHTTEESEVPEAYTEKIEGTDVSIKDIFDRGNTDTTAYRDILRDEDVRKAIANTNKEAFDKAINKLADNGEITEVRKNKVKEYFNEDKFAQYERGENPDTNVISKLNKPTKKDIESKLNIPNAEISKEDATKTDDNLKNYVYQQILARDELPNKIGEDIKSELTGLSKEQVSVVDKAIGEITNTANKAKEINEQLRGNKVYKSEKEAKEALRKLSKSESRMGITGVLKVRKVDDNRFIIAGSKIAEAFKDYNELIAKDDISAEDLDKFINDYKDELTVYLTETTIEQLKAIHENYVKAPENKKKESKERLTQALTEVISREIVFYGDQVKRLEGDIEVDTVIHGYTKRNYIREASAQKRKEDTEKAQAKETKEQSKLEKEVDKLTEAQANNLVVHALYTSFRYFGSTDATRWGSDKRFTIVDIRNLKALINSRKLGQTELNYAQTLLACMQKTDVINDDTSVAHAVNFTFVYNSPNHDFVPEIDAVQGAKGYNAQLREKYEKAFGEEVPSNIMYLPESLMDSTMAENLLSEHIQRKRSNNKKYIQAIRNNISIFRGFLSQLDAFKISVKDTDGAIGENTALSQICKEAEVSYPTNIALLSNAEVVNMTIAFMQRSSSYLKALGLDIGSADKITSNNFTRLNDNRSPTTIYDINTVKPTKLAGISITLTTGKNKTDIDNFNTGDITLKERLIILDKILDADGGFIDAFMDNKYIKENAAISDLYRDLAVTRLASNIEALSKAEEFLKKIGLEKFGDTPEKLLKQIINIYQKSGTAISNLAVLTKSALLYAIAKKLNYESGKVKDESNLTDPNYAKYLKLYSFVETLPEQNLVNYKDTPYVEDEVTTKDLIPLAYNLIPEITYLDDLRTELESANDTNFISESEYHQIIQTLYLADNTKDTKGITVTNGIIDITGNHLSNLSPELQLKLAKILANKFNRDLADGKIKVISPTITGRSHSSTEFSFSKVKTNISSDIKYSEYSEDLISKPKSILAYDGLYSEDSIYENNPDYAGLENGVIKVLKKIHELNLHGTKFLKSNYIIDSIFGTNINGRVCYSRELLSVLSATGLNNLSGINMGQSEDWLTSMVSGKFLSPKAASVMATLNFADYQTFALSIGRQVMNSLGIRLKGENSRPIVAEKICVELGSRVLHLLESAGYVTKSYLTYDGDLTSEPPKEGTFRRVLKLTKNKGEPLLTDLNNTVKYSYKTTSGVNKNSNILDDLLGTTKEKTERSTTDFKAYQEQLKKRFESDSKTYKVTTFKDVEVPHAKKKATVDVCKFTGITRVTLSEERELKGILDDKGNPVKVKEIYLDRNATYKADGVMNEPIPLVELAYKNTEGQKVHLTKYTDIFENEIQKAKSWKDLPPKIQKALGMDTKNTVSIFENYRIDKNEQIFRAAKEFDSRIKQYKDGDIVYFPVVMTPNNRFLVNSPWFNYREFKPMREFFSPVHEEGFTTIPANRTEGQQKMLKGVILFNLGLDVDKMLFKDIDTVFDKFTDAYTTISADTIGQSLLAMLFEGNKLDVDKNTNTVKIGNRELTDEEKTILKPLLDIQFDVYKGVKKTKGIEFSGSTACQALYQDLTSTKRNLLNQIKNNKELTDFDYIIEVDGLNNGSGHHFSQSSVFSNTDEISIAKSIAVGIIPPSLSGTYGDFVTAMAESNGKYLDVYMLSAKTGEELAKEDFATMIITGLRKDPNGGKKISLLKVLAKLYDVKDKTTGKYSTNIEEIIPELLSRDVMKQVAMPNTYGAGMEALLFHLATGIDKKIAEFVAKTVAKAKDANAEIQRLYDELREFNNGYLTLVDFSGKEVNYSDVRGKDNLSNYIPLVYSNDALFNLLKDTCLIDAVQGARAVTQEASDRARVLNQANEVICKVFTATVRKVLDTHFKDRDLLSLTWKEQEQILSIVSTKLNFGTQKQSLDVLRPALMGALAELSYNKVTGYYEGGSSSVRFKTELDRESLGSALPPVFIHGFDSGNIAYAQQRIRDALGAFTGVHDAIMIMYKQLTSDPDLSAPEAMNEGFAEGFLTAHIPLLHMAHVLNVSLEYLPDLDGETTGDIHRAINALRSYAGIEIDNAQKILYKIQDDLEHNRPTYTFNQFSNGEWSAFTPDKAWVNQKLSELNKSIQTSTLIKPEYVSYDEFLKEFIQVKHKDLYKLLTRSGDFTTVIFNLAQLKEIVNSKANSNAGTISLGLSQEQKKQIEKLIEDYVKFKQGKYDLSFYKNFLDAQQEYNEEKTKSSFNTLLNDASKAKGTQEIIKALLTLGTNGEAFDNITRGKTGFISRFLSSNLFKLQGLLHKDSNSYHVLAGLIKLTTKNEDITNTDLNQLIELMDDSGYLNDNLETIKPLDSNAQSIFINVTDINLRDFLDYIESEHQESTYKDKQISRKDRLTNYLDKYLDALEKELKNRKGTKQIIFRMDSAIDLMLLGALNQRIKQANSDDIFNGLSLVIAPSITDKAGMGINKNLTHYSNLNKTLGDKLNNFTVLNTTKNKDLQLQNYIHRSQFSKEGLSGQYLQRTYDVSTTPEGRPNTGEQLNKKETIYMANYYGDIESTHFSDSCVPSMLYVQRTASDIVGISGYENSVLNFPIHLMTQHLNAKPIVEVETNTLSIHDTNFADFKNGADIVISLNSDGSFVEDKEYNIFSKIPAFNIAYKQALDAHKRMERRFKNDPNIQREAVLQPITVTAHLNNLTKVRVTFMITKDPTISLQDLHDVITGQNPSASNYQVGNYVFAPNPEGISNVERDRLQAIKNKFKDYLVNNEHVTDPTRGFSNWVRKQEQAYRNASDKSVRIRIPKEFLNEEDNVFDSNPTMRVINDYWKSNHTENVIYIGESALPYRGIQNSKPTVYTFEGVKGKEQQEAIASNFRTAMNTSLTRTLIDVRNKIRMNKYTSNKSAEDMNVYDRAVYKDLTCSDANNLFNTLNQEDKVRGLDTSHLDRVFNKLKTLNINVRYYLNNLAYSQGGAFIETINAKPTGYINFNTRGTGSHAEVFVHEYCHIPLEYLKYDANAYRLATQLYQFSASNLTLEDFDCSREEAERIYNYIFRDTNTVDPQIEFLTYSLTNADFRRALDKMAQRTKFRKEFNDKKESVLARFVNTISGSLDTSRVSNNINAMVFDIFKRSVDLCNEYGKKAPRDEDAYITERLQLSSTDAAIYNAIGSLSKLIGSNPVTDQIIEWGNQEKERDVLRNISKSEKNRNRIPDVLPQLLDTFSEVKGEYSNIANQLRQSFEGVSEGNYEYVKLRYKAKETIDKARESASSALNKIVQDLTKDISQKTLNEMAEYVIKADISCLMDGNLYDKDTLKKLLSDSAFRRQEINNLENNLRRNNMGNYLINASKGLVDKLTIGVNTSGIGYSNAYEIANMSGTNMATTNSSYTSTIDKYVTLQVMDYLDKKNRHVYSELSRNIDTLVELLNIHSGLKKLEYSDVYANSMQKVHIPKGELHGGKISNKFTVVPKSQLEAYRWAGYKDEGKVKFDQFYSTIAGEEFHKVSAKHMPDVPYVDGIPVLTDIFNGRNKSGTYLGGKKLESTQINPTFNNVEMNALSSYIQSRIKALNSSKYTPLNPKNIDGVIAPTFGIGNKLSGCDFQLNQKESDKYLNRHIKFTSALGDHYGSIIERTRAPEWNIEASKALDDLYQSRHTKHDFTWLNENVENADYLEIYNLLPYEMKKYFIDKYNGKGVPVETRYLTGIVGYREISANKIDKNDLEWNNKLRKSFTDYLSHIFHNGYVAKGETFLRYLTKLGKENLVIKGVAVSVDNILSNNVTLSVLGLSPEQVCKYQIEGLNNLLKYKEMSRERYMLKTKEITNTLTEADRARIRGLEASMKALPISYLAEHGAMPTIAEDLTESDRLAKDFIDRNLPKELQTFAHNAIGDQKSWAYRHLSDLATFGDITARYAQFKYLTEDKHINKEEAFRQCMQTFIDYSNPLPRNLQYFDSIGALPFTKFLLGNQTNVLNSLVKKPSRALAGIMATSAMGIPSIYDSILGLDAITNRWKVPGFGLWYDSLGSLPISRAIDIL